MKNTTDCLMKERRELKRDRKFDRRYIEKLEELCDCMEENSFQIGQTVCIRVDQELLRLARSTRRMRKNREKRAKEKN